MPSIHEAARAGDLETVRQLVAEDPALVDADDQYEWRPLFHAALCRHTEVVRFLIESGADLSAHDGYVLHYGGEVPDNKPVVELLVRYGALEAHVQPLDSLSGQFLMAVFLADAARVRNMLALHPDLATAVDGRGDEPIHHAARNGDTEIVGLLIESGADANTVSQRGNTVLYCAAGHGHLQTVQLLVENGARIDTPFTDDGRTVPQWLAQFPDDVRLSSVATWLAQQSSLE